MEEIYTPNYYIRERWGEIVGRKYKDKPALTGISQGWELKGYHLIVNGREQFTKGKIVAVFNDTERDVIVAASFNSTEKFNEFLKYHSEIEVIKYKSYFEFEGIKEVANPNFTWELDKINKEYSKHKFDR